MNKLIQRLNRWAHSKQINSSSDVGEIEQKSGEIQPIELPPPIRSQLVKEIRSLPTHFSRSKLVETRLSKAIQNWKNDYNAPNCLVVLNNSVEPITEIISTCLGQEIESLKPVFLQNSFRPEQYNTVWEVFQSNLEKSIEKSKSESSYFSSIQSPLYLETIKTKTRLNEPNSNEISINNIDSNESINNADLNKAVSTANSRSLLVIPCLDWCFLRCVDGLDAIDELQSAVLNDRSRFWLIGCSDWAWQYLEQIFQVGSFLEQTLTVPALTGLELKQWLTPVSNMLDLDSYWRAMADAKSKPEVEENWASKAEQSYFENLAVISTGIPHIAAEIWLRSLRISQFEQGSISVADPELPALPKLTVDDRYLLFSLVLHRTISLSHLAISLGEDERIVQRQVQVLQRTGIVEQHNSALQINPAYYIRLKSDFKRNNFLVKEVEA